jgi:hypothetical protein
MTPEDAQALLEVARWTLHHQNRRITIRQLAETEENYLLLIRELERVESQRFLAQARHAEATLTLVGWLESLNYFHWRCAYCQSKPFQVKSHPLPLSQGGTTATNCVPACYRCRQFQKREDERIRSSLALIHPCKEGVELHL